MLRTRNIQAFNSNKKPMISRVFSLRLAAVTLLVLIAACRGEAPKGGKFDG